MLLQLRDDLRLYDQYGISRWSAQQALGGKYQDAWRTETQVADRPYFHASMGTSFLAFRCVASCNT